MFDDIIKEKKKPTADEIVERCSTCAHAEVLGGKPAILCTIAMGGDCANNIDNPFNMWKTKNV